MVAEADHSGSMDVHVGYKRGGGAHSSCEVSPTKAYFWTPQTRGGENRRGTNRELHRCMRTLLASVASMVALLGMASSSVACTTVTESEEEPMAFGTKDAKVLKSYQIPLSEISGLAATSNALFAIGDRAFEVVRMPIEKAGLGKPQVFDVKNLIKDRASASQWEGIAVDGSGRVFVLEENPGRIFVFSADLKSLEQTIELEIPKSSDLRDDWDKEENSRGEGLVLLRNGHILVAKEKAPRRLVEFGPSSGGKSKFGSSKIEALAPGSTFNISEDEVFVPVSETKMDNSTDDVLKDLSEIAADDRGQLFAVSGESGILSRLSFGSEVDTSSEIRLKGITNPEGLAIVGKRVFVASDQPGSGPSLFEIEVK